MTLSKNESRNFSLATYQPTTQDGIQCNIELYEGSAIIIINLILTLVGTCGNVLIICAVSRTPQLRQKSFNFLLLSLAIVDLLVTMVALPLHTTSMCFKTYHHSCVSKIGFAYDVILNLSVSCSVFHFSAISIDRAIASLKPHKYQDVMKRRGLKIMLTTCWGTTLVFTCVRVLFAEAMIIFIGLMVIKYDIIVAAYIAVLCKIRLNKSNPSLAARSTSATQNAPMEKRVSLTIFGFYIHVDPQRLETLEM